MQYIATKRKLKKKDYTPYPGFSICGYLTLTKESFLLHGGYRIIYTVWQSKRLTINSLPLINGRK